MDQALLAIVEENDEESLAIPSWESVSQMYESRWLKEKEKFQNQLRQNFKALVERFACGKQEIFVLCVPDRRENQYKRAFLELFESGYAPHVGDVERLAGKKARRLYITLPHNYADWLDFYTEKGGVITIKPLIEREVKNDDCCCLIN